MDQIRFYRSRAAAERAAADTTRLPHARERHLRAAEVWEAMADKLDHVAGAKARNQAARREQRLAEEEAERRRLKLRSRLGRGN